MKDKYTFVKDLDPQQDDWSPDWTLIHYNSNRIGYWFHTDGKLARFVDADTDIRSEYWDVKIL